MQLKKIPFTHLDSKKLLSLYTACREAFFSLIERLRPHLDRRHCVFAHDLFMCALALCLTFWSQTGEGWPLLKASFVFKHTLVFMLVSACIFLWLQLYRGMWRYVSGHEILATLFAAGYATALYFPLMVLMSTSTHIPRVSIVVLFFFTAFLLLSSRIAYRFTKVRWFDDETPLYSSQPPSRVLLMGTMAEIGQCLEDLKPHKNLPFVILGALTPWEKDVGRFVEGIEILGVSEDLETIVTHFNFEDRHPHHIVLLGPKTDNLQVLHRLGSLLPRLGIDLTHLVAKKGHPVQLEPLAFKDFVSGKPASLTEPSSQETKPAPPLGSRRILLVGVSTQMGMALATRLRAQGKGSLFLSDTSPAFLTALQSGLEEDTDPTLVSENTSVILLAGTSQEDFSQAIREADPEIIVTIPPLVPDAFFQSSPVRSLDLIQKHMFGILDAAITLNRKTLVVLFPCSRHHFADNALLRYFNLLQAQMCQYLTQHKSPCKIFFLYTGNVAEFPDSLLSLAKKSLEKIEPPKVSQSLKTYEFSSLESLVEKVEDYLQVLAEDSHTIPLETQIQPDITSTPEELLEQLKALYPLPNAAHKLDFIRTPSKENKSLTRPFKMSRSPQTGYYSIQNKSTLEDLVTSINQCLQKRDDTRLLELLS